MQSQQALQKEEQRQSTGLFAETEKVFDQMKEFTQAVARRAYEFFETRGRELGHDLEDWFKAESEVLRRVPVEIKEIEGKITVRAEVPGFTPNEIKVNVEPERLVISGKSEQKTEEKKEEPVYSEFRSKQFYRELMLPAAVDPAQASSSLKDGILEIALTKTEAPKVVNVEVKSAS